MQDYDDTICLDDPERGLGSNQIELLDFARKHGGWVGINQHDRATQRAAKGLHRRVLIAALGRNGIIHQIRAYDSTWWCQNFVGH